MNREELHKRKAELEAGLANATNSVWVLRGHLQEIEYQIQSLIDVAQEKVVDLELAND